MHAIEWRHILDALAAQYGKHLLTRSELANVAAAHSAQVDDKEISRLLKHGVLKRYAHGLYGLPGLNDVRLLIPLLDESAYITGRYGMFQHGLLSQVPAEITCFTQRGRNFRRRVQTAFGTVRLSCVRPPVYCQPASGVVAPPEQCLCDWLFLVLGEGRRPEGMGTFFLGTLDDSKLWTLLNSYPASVRRCLKRLRSQKLEGVRGSSETRKLMD